MKRNATLRNCNNDGFKTPCKIVTNVDDSGYLEVELESGEVIKLHESRVREVSN